MDAARKTQIANEASAKYVGKRGIICPKCKGVLFYVNAMGGVSCRVCSYPKKPEHVRLPLILIRGEIEDANGKVIAANIWADGRDEKKIETWHKQSGISVGDLRCYLSLIQSMDRVAFDGESNSVFKQIFPRQLIDSPK